MKTDRISPQDRSIAFHQFDGKDEGRREVLLALGNGYFVTRACPVHARQNAVHYPGTYCAGNYNWLVSEIQGGQDREESLVNLPNWTYIAIDSGGDSQFAIYDSSTDHYLHSLDMRTGTTVLEYTLHDHGGRMLHVRERRLVSMADPHVAAIRLELTPHDWSGAIAVISEIDGNVENLNIERFEDYQHRHLLPVHGGTMRDGIAILHVRTLHSGIDIVQASKTTIDGELLDEQGIESTMSPGHRMHCAVTSGATLVMEKIVSIHTSAATSYQTQEQAERVSGDAEANAGLIEDTLATLDRSDCFASLAQAHVAAWQKLWTRAAIDIENQAVDGRLRFHVFHILQTLSPHTSKLDVGIPSRGWHGEGYHGHVFWDELFVLPFLLFRFPEVAKGHLMYRCRRLQAARDAARQAGYRGAMYPWRSASDGSEVTPHHQKNLLSGDWMEDHTYLQRHVGSAVAFNIWHYYLATEDTDFLADYGAEVMLEIARFWSSIAVYREQDDRFEIRSVIGPDEYHNAYPWRNTPGLDNNAYTNVMAVWTLCRAVDVLAALPPLRCAELRVRLQLEDDELAYWDRVSRRMYIPFQENGVINQFDGFERLAEYSDHILPPALRDERTDWALHAAGKDVNHFQVIKQADALTIFYLLPEDEVSALFERLGYECSNTCILETAHHYLARSAHRSSLSRIVYAGALARLDPDTSWDLYLHLLDTDLDQLKGESVSEGVHLASMGGAIDILQRRYLGIGAGNEGLIINPALPAKLGKVKLGLQYRGNRLTIESTGQHVGIQSDEANRVFAIICRGEKIMLAPGEQIWLSGNATETQAETS